MSTTSEKKNSLGGSVSKVSSATAFSRILGLIREQTMAYFFGASMATDAFVTAFRIPNLLRDLFAEGALSSAFVPVFKEKLVAKDQSEAFGLAQITATAILVAVGGVVLLGIVATPAIVFVSANGFTADPVKYELTISLTRLMFVYLLLVSLSALVMGMLNSLGRFGIPALSPAMFNLGVIASVVGLHQYLQTPVYALAIGVLVGGLGQLAIQLPSLIRIGFRFRPRFDFLNESFKKVVRLMLPMIGGLSASRVNILVNTLIASFLMEGSISFLNYSYRLMHFPMGVFAVALGTVILPRASEAAARGDNEELSQAFHNGVNLNMFLILPSAAVLVFLGRDIVDLVYHWGAFSETDAVNTALALRHYSYGLIGFAAVRVTVPIFYALKDSSLPMKASLASVAINMALYYPLIQVLDFAGLAAATSIAGLVNFILLLYFLPRKGIEVAYGRLLLSFTRLGLAAALAVFAASLIKFGISSDLPYKLGAAVDLGLTLAVAGAAYLLLCYLFRVREVSLVFKRIFRRRL